MKWRFRQQLVRDFAAALKKALEDEENETPEEIAAVVVDELDEKYEFTPKTPAPS